MNEVTASNAGRQAAVPAVPQQYNSLTRQLKVAWDKRKMDRNLSRWFAAAKDFKANGLPPGSPAYEQLYRQSCDTIAAHSQKWGIPADRLAVERPGLYNLQKLASPATQRQANPIAMVFAVLFLLFGAAGALGGAAGVFHLVERLIAR